MVNELSISEALKLKEVCFIDVRSEGEYEEGSIPGSINIPVFNNEERAQVGTLYKQVGTEEAKELGIKIASPKLLELYNRIRDLSNQKQVVLYCWRGGMRSKYTATILETFGLKVGRVKGGYKAYRRYVHSYLDVESVPHKSIVLHGLTGVGKTLILQKLKEQGFPILDLEGIAKHRGSAYGKICMPESPSQKDFEAKIVEDLVAAEKLGIFIVECESRRLGKLTVPTSVMNSMAQGYRILLYASVPARVERIISDYTEGPDNNIKGLQNSTSHLEKKLGKKVVEDLNEQIAQKKFDQVIPYLLKQYYDPLYKYPDQPDSRYHLSVNCDDLEQAAHQIANWIKSLPEYGVPVEIGGEHLAHRGRVEERPDEKGLFL